MPTEHDSLIALIRGNEEWLVAQILEHAKRREYTRYTSTLLEAWRQSIVGLSQTLCDFLARPDESWELSPDEDLTQSPETQYATAEALKHRERGISLGMFLGLMKYYQECYLELIAASELPESFKPKAAYSVRRYFDRLEVAFCTTWMSGPNDEQIRLLQEKNRALTNEKNRYLTIFESLDDPVFVFDKDGGIVTLNRAALSTFGSGKIPGEVTYGAPVSLPLAPDLTQHALQGEQEFEREYSTNDGIRRYAVKIKPLVDFSERDVGTLAAMRDTTARHSLSRQLESAVRELGDRNSKLETALEQLANAQTQLIESERMASVGLLAAGVAHEINNPTGFVATNFNQLAEYVNQLLILTERLGSVAVKPIPPDGRRSETDRLLVEHEFDFIRDDVTHLIVETRDGLNRITRIVRQLLDFSRQGKEDGPIRIDIRHCVETTLALAANEFKHRVNIVNDLQSIPPVKAHPSEISQVILNLLTNAVHAAEGGTVTVRTYFSNNRTILSIEDNGCGIPPEVLDRIFDPFFTTKPAGKGTGLGLPIVKRIVEKYDGRVDIESAPGQGTVVSISFPAARTDEG